MQIHSTLKPESIRKQQLVLFVCRVFSYKTNSAATFTNLANKYGNRWWKNKTELISPSSLLDSLLLWRKINATRNKDITIFFFSAATLHCSAPVSRQGARSKCKHGD
ncbi:hypothetical protein TNIN_389401 [Trichonephila inaurata madagascariensis]|uniref:Uncharacterized protein n=1 Tax=Trichonephila inaurata madagascariensis TaxID=2747483 RepID=A0A8X6XQJ1_9ARAC|nr:hypothetical protein TNIN_389401 [Trichonephila inaurata madagascariensis]